MVVAPIDFLPPWAVIVITLVAGGSAMEIGYRIGRWRHVRATEEKETPVGAMVAAILGLLAFMLAFTFSLAAARYDAKRQTVLDEANAIGTTYLRTQLLPEPQKTETARLLREYVDIRVRGVEEGNVAEAIAQSEKLQEQIWQEGVAAADKQPTIMTGLYIQALNQMIDVHSTRLLVGIRSHIPASIWTGLIFLAMLGIAAMGYQAGLSATRRSPAMLALVLGFAGVLFLIADLDRGREGFLTIDQTAMTDLQRSMHAGK